ncbi:MAG: 3-hydroxyisobutyrate dehydrogenase [Porticoccaceae bacterium]|nr:MAG: 3-hydroxyisobutyrate dehydrogenase [Porticoccaceae bacterium]
MATIGFIGLGNMGGPMAANLAAKGFRVRAFDLVEAARQRAQEAGCEVVGDPREAVAEAEFAITMLPSGPIVRDLWIERDLLSAVPAGCLVIDCSTVAPEDSRALARAATERGLAFLDAPVSGGVAAAAAGTLAFMCGGEAADVERARPVLLAMGSRVFHAGGHGAGAAAKLCNNLLLAIHMIGTAEALQLGVDNGLDPKVLSEIMRASSGNNWSLEKYNPYPGVMEGVPAARGYQGGFAVDLMLKDLNLALDAARERGSAVPMGALARNLYALHRGADPERGRRDFSSILELFRRSAKSL